MQKEGLENTKWFSSLCTNLELVVVRQSAPCWDQNGAKLERPLRVIFLCFSLYKQIKQWHSSIYGDLIALVTAFAPNALVRKRTRAFGVKAVTQAIRSP